ncbi:MAG: hypothetical protein J6S68_07035 [Acinetobacter sp.]|nr:hypothetical protein [Acinetobacter sp.]
MSQIAALRRKIESLIIAAKQNYEPSPMDQLNPVQRTAVENWLSKIETDAEKTPEGFYIELLEQEWSLLDQFIEMEKNQ